MPQDKVRLHPNIHGCHGSVSREKVTDHDSRVGVQDGKLIQYSVSRLLSSAFRTIPQPLSLAPILSPDPSTQERMALDIRPSTVPLQGLQ